MTPTRRVAVLIGLVALGALVLPTVVVVGLLAALLVAAGLDARSALHGPRLARRLPAIASRGVASPVEVDVTGWRNGRPLWLRAFQLLGYALEVSAAPDVIPAPRLGSRRVRLRQPVDGDLCLDPSEADGALHTVVVPRRRGRHEFGPVAVRVTGQFGLVRRDSTWGEVAEVRVYPDLPQARRIAQQVRTGRFRDPGQRPRGPLGIGTEFETVRDYLPDDDLRQVNWRATQRLGRPMSNQFREENERDVLCVVDAGRLMAAPVGEGSRLDVALDAVAAVAAVADALGDRCGTLAFDQEVRQHLRPRRAGGRAVLDTLYDLEPRLLDSDYEGAFARAARGKRALVLVLTDLLDLAAARSLLGAVPTLVSTHAVVIASVTDPDVEQLARTVPTDTVGAYALAVAHDVLEERARVVAELARAGAHVIEADAATLPAACVGAYLRLKARARL